MPHQCIDCDEIYEDGSDSVLSGCAECAGTTFQYVPASGTAQSTETESSGIAELPEEVPESQPEPTDHLGGGVINVGSDDDDDTSSPTSESATQHDARTDVVDADELPDPPHPTEKQPKPSESEVSANLDAIRRELNRQFEGIQIVAPGHYELNLMELYRREECIITLHEDGRYAIGVPGDEDFSLESPED